MKIYLAHSRDFDYKKDLYDPIRQSSLNQKHNFVLPHESTNEPFDSRSFLKNSADLIIAEVSRPTTGLGIELGWADVFNVPIVCIYRKGSRLSGSLKVVTDNFIEYSTHKELIDGIERIISKMQR